MTLRFLHLADLHLDTAWGGQPATRDRLREATRQAFAAAIDLALTEALDAVLVAGDGFDEERLDFGTELWLTRQVRRLSAGGIDLIWIAGNHDPGGPGGRLAGLGLGSPGGAAAPSGLSAATRSAPGAVHIVQAGEPRTLELRGKDGGLRGLVACAGHATSAETDNLAARFPRLAADVPTVGLLHTQVHAAAGAAEHASYAPSTEADLAAPGYDYWALGHVHRRGRPFPRVPAWYAGNLCGRHPGEHGPKGGLVVELEAGSAPLVRFVELAPTRWERREVGSLAHCRTAAELADALARAAEEAQEQATGAELLLRLIPTGPCPLAPALAQPSSREALEAELRERTGLLEVQLRPRGLHVSRSLEELREHPSALASALELAQAWEQDPEGAFLEPTQAPDRLQLAGLPTDPAQRTLYLQQLTVDLAETLLQRTLPAPATE